MLSRSSPGRKVPPGGFSAVQTDPFFTTQDRHFQLVFDNPGGAGSLTLVAVPEPAVAGVLLFALAARRRARPRRRVTR